jgi:hypothetical protein
MERYGARKEEVETLKAGLRDHTEAAQEWARRGLPNPRDGRKRSAWDMLSHYKVTLAQLAKVRVHLCAAHAPMNISHSYRLACGEQLWPERYARVGETTAWHLEVEAQYKYVVETEARGIGHTRH